MTISGWQLENLYRNRIIDYVPYDLCYAPGVPYMPAMSNPYTNGINTDLMLSENESRNQFSQYGNVNQEIGNNYFQSATGGQAYNLNESDSFISQNGYAVNGKYINSSSQTNGFKDGFNRFLNNSYNVAPKNSQTGTNNGSNISRINSMKQTVSSDGDSPDGAKISNPAILKGVAGFGVVVLLTVMGFKGCKKLVNKLFKKA